jgi:PAS domain S-box-containing protein
MSEGNHLKHFITLHYGLALAAAAAATGTRLALNPMLGENSPYLPFVLAIIVTARFGGRGPSLAATVLSTLSAWYFFVEPYYSFAMPKAAAMGGLALFAVIGVIISLLISQVRQALLSSARSEEQLRLATLAGGIGVWSWTPGANNLTVSGGWRHIFGIAADIDVSFDTWRNALHPEDRDQVASELQAAGSQHSEFSSEYRIVGPSGKVRWIADRGQTFHRRRGRAARMAGANMDITERKHAEQALREKTSRLEELNRALDLACTMVWTPDGTITYWSQGAAELYGWARDQAIGRRVNDLLKTEYPAPFEEIKQHLLAFDGWKGELRHRRSDGVTVVAASHWSVQRDEQGRPSAVVEANNDVTAARRAEEGLRRAHEHLERRSAQVETVLDSLTEGLVISDLEGRTFRWNPAAVAMHGFSRREECPHKPAEFAEIFELSTGEGGSLPPGEWPLARILRGDVLRDYEVQIRRRGTDWQRVFRYAGTLARDSRGTPLLAVLSVSDVTEVREAQESLRHSEERFRRLVKVSAQIVWVTNAQGEQETDSPSWRAFTGRTLTEWLGKNWLEAIHPDDRQRVNAGWRRSVEMVTPYRDEFRQLHASGEYRHMLCQAAPVLNPDGAVREWVGMNPDITERKRAEEALLEGEERLRWRSR